MEIDDVNEIGQKNTHCPFYHPSFFFLFVRALPPSACRNASVFFSRHHLLFLLFHHIIRIQLCGMMALPLTARRHLKGPSLFFFFFCFVLRWSLWIPFQKEDGPKYYLYQLEGEGSDDRDQEKSALLLVLKMYKETVNNKDVVSVVLQRGRRNERETKKNFHVIYLASF